VLTRLAIALESSFSGPLLLVGLGLLFFLPLVVHPTQVLYSPHSDILAEHIPARHFLVRSWHETGELPLWCPCQFGGGPFVHDIQVAIFYPPHLVFFLLPEDWVGVALSWLVVLHVLVAGLGMYAYARCQGLKEAGAVVAGIGYMFAGKWLLHLLGGGHYVVVGLAWLPLVLLFLERAIRRGSFLDATWAGAVFGLLALGTQPQWTFYAGLFIALWTLGTAFADPPPVVAGSPDPATGPDRRSPLRSEDRRPAVGGVAWSGDQATTGGAPDTTRPSGRWSALLRWAGFGAWTVLVGAGLAAVQFLPTLEAAGQSTRTAGVADDALAGGLQTLLFLAGPALIAEPYNVAWEDRGGFGVLWLAAAALAPFLCRGRVRFQAGVCLGLIVFACGGAVLFQGLPGFRLFRQHARMIMLAALPVAYLAGVTTDALLRLPGLTPETRRLSWRVFGRVLVGVVILAGGFTVRRLLTHGDVRFHLYWLTLPVTVPVTFWLLGGRGALAPQRWAVVWGLVLLADVWGLARPLVAVRPESEVYPPSACVDFLAGQRGDHGRVLDADVSAADCRTPLGSGSPLAMLRGLEGLRGYTPLDNRRFKEYLQFIADRDDPLVPMKNPLAWPVIHDIDVVNRPLLDLLGVRYLLQPRAQAVGQQGWGAVFQDQQPRAYDFIEGGVRDLPPYTVYENSQALDRVFVVSQAAALPPRGEVLSALKQTDFRQTVLLETELVSGGVVRSEEAQAGDHSPLTTHHSPRALLRDYRPNRVAVDVDEGPAGFLVLTDVWYPGWVCTVDGVDRPVRRANFLFRAVELPPGRHEVIFTFAPASYRRGRLVSAAVLGLVGVVLLFGTAWRWRAVSAGAARSAP
jgi:hypothetical protein